ncbi:LytTR family DNA-binding domain-containing protein [uncultured Tenacibaculum sp.]|uniref:LytR/AlgR family response regulator transcription factor n=1 Tax=uncultured Tenacibaculum sp. TaxID=174713 RepID=UPI00263736CB|nr:LytTR family DNA-binding domain-containing protein [uncultured Tenacibaculum sp.]
MKVLIIEDEIAAAEHLKYLLERINIEIKVLTILDSVKSSVKYLKEANDIQLIFMDIHLSDGLSFEIFDIINIQTPIIFTTAYNQYAIKAFKVNSIDYLLKPINIEELEEAINKFKVLDNSTKEDTTSFQVQELLKLLKIENPTYKNNYLVQKQDTLLPLSIDSIAFFTIDTGIVKAVTLDNKSFIINEKLEDIEEEINPKQFYRANRQYIINKDSIVNIKPYFTGKLILNIKPPTKEKIMISRAKSKNFKDWINS